MIEENIAKNLDTKNKDGTRNSFLEEIEKNELMSRKHKKVVKL